MRLTVLLMLQLAHRACVGCLMELSIGWFPTYHLLVGAGGHPDCGQRTFSSLLIETNGAMLVFVATARESATQLLMGAAK